MSIPLKEKRCDGIGKAYGFEGCGKMTIHRTYGLCNMKCYPTWLMDTEAGQIEFQKKIMPKAKKLTANREKEKTKIAKAKVTKWNEKLQGKVNEIARLIDKGLPCLARNFTNCQIHGGHVFARGGNSSIKYNLHNIHRQSAQSNKWQNDDGLLREGIVKEYGQDYMDFISGLRRTEPLNFKNEEYHTLYLKASKMANNLRKTLNYPLTEKQRIELRNTVNKELGIYADEYCNYAS